MTGILCVHAEREGGRKRECVRLQNFPQRQKDKGSDAGKEICGGGGALSMNGWLKIVFVTYCYFLNYVYVCMSLWISACGAQNSRGISSAPRGYEKLLLPFIGQSPCFKAKFHLFSPTDFISFLSCRIGHILK